MNLDSFTCSLIIGLIIGTILSCFIHGLLSIVGINVFHYIMLYVMSCSLTITLGYFVGFSNGFSRHMSTVDLNPDNSTKRIISGFKFSLISGCLVGVTLYGLLLAIGMRVSIHIVPLTVLYFVCFITSYFVGSSFGYNARRKEYFKSFG